MNSYLKIAIIIVAFVAGFFLGRKTIDVIRLSLTMFSNEFTEQGEEWIEEE